MPRDPTVFRDAGMTPFADVVPVGATFGVAALYSTLYSIAVTLGRFRYPRYVHHRNIHALYHTWHWVLGGFRKLWFKVLERDRIEQFSGPLSGRFFFVPLQVHCDAQLDHSPYADVCDFMEEVAESFSSHAPEDAHLLFKHHPADRPFREYGSFVAQLARKHGLQGRLHYVHDLHLPTLLRHTVGTVTINSTVGLSSIHHAAPTKVLGNAVYDIEGLTHQGDLASFWHDPGEVDLDLYIAYRGWLEHHNQANGSIWKPLHTDDAGTGLRWWDRPPRTQEPKR